MGLKPEKNTIIDVLLELQECDRFGARFVSRLGQSAYYPYKEILQRAKSVAGTLQAQGLEKGDRVAIVLPTSIHFPDIFLGTQLAGGIPAALYPPFALGRLTEYFNRTERMLAKIGTRFFVTDRRIKKIMGPAVEKVDCVERVLNAEDLLKAMTWSPVDPDPEAPAFLQFSSGTTAEPKAVMVSHTNLLCNLEMIDTFFQSFSDMEAEQGAVSWLPLYHDMGLVGCMYLGLYHPGTVTYIPPELFIAKPAIWLQTMSQYKGVISAAPDFAYALCLERIRDEDLEGVDLSHWVVTLNGAEPIDPKTMHRFWERFARWGLRPEAMTPGYGLAEAGLAVSFSDPSSPPVVTEFEQETLAGQGRAVPGKGRRLPSVGRPMTGLTVEIRDTEDRQLPDGRVGRILVQGPSVATGYFNDPEPTAQTFKDGWLDTGDLGFFYREDLYIAGRVKDLIILRGKNYSPQEIEEVVQGVEGLRMSCSTAVSHEIEGHGEQLIMLCEKDVRSRRPEEEIITDIKKRLLSALAIVPYHVQILDPDTIPRTSSGKMRRAHTLRMFLNGELRPPKKMNALKIIKEVGKSQVAWGRFWLRKQLGKR